MKKLFELLIIATIIFTSCNNQQSSSTSADKVTIDTLSRDKVVSVNKEKDTSLATVLEKKQIIANASATTDKFVNNNKEQSTSPTTGVGKKQISPKKSHQTDQTVDTKTEQTISPTTVVKKKESILENKKSEFDFKKEFCILNSFMKKYEDTSQFFNISIDKPTKITGREGIIIYINPNDLELINGQPLEKNIEVELKELLNQKQLLRANAQTVSNGELLESGGAYYINLTSDGQPLKLKESKTLEVKLPKYTDNEMLLFYGERNDFGQMNWKKADTLKPSKQSKPTYDVVISYIENETTKKYVLTTDTLFDEESFEKVKIELKITEGFSKYKILPGIPGIEKCYEFINLKKLGWINCDRFANVKNKTTLSLFCEKQDTQSVGIVFVVFKAINSIIEESWHFKYNNLTINNLPIGTQVKLIAIEYKEGKKYSYMKDITIKAGESTQIDFKEATDDDINKLFSDI